MALTRVNISQSLQDANLLSNPNMTVKPDLVYDSGMGILRILSHASCAPMKKVKF